MNTIAVFFRNFGFVYVHKASHLAYKSGGGTEVEFLLIVSKTCFHRSMILVGDFY